MPEPKIPDPRDDDHDDIADKLSIAAAMWGRGDRADALSWLRRAAESASDLEQDVRALELAKAASELAPFVDATQALLPAVSPAGAPASARGAPAAAVPVAASQGPSQAGPSAPKPSGRPPVPSGRPPVPSGRPAAPSAAKAPKPPGSKLPPLPPIRPLGSAPTAPVTPPTQSAQPAPAKPAQAVQRTPSMVTSALGATSASGTVTKEDPTREASKPMPWDDQADDEPTKQIAIAPSEATDHEATGTHEIDSAPLSPPREAQTPQATLAAAPELPLAVGVRVRLMIDEHGRVFAEPDRGQTGVLALLVPAAPDEDLRPLFQPRA